MVISKNPLTTLAYSLQLESYQLGFKNSYFYDI